MPAVCSAPLTTGRAHTPMDPTYVRGALHTADIGDNSSFQWVRKHQAKYSNQDRDLKKIKLSSVDLTCRNCLWIIGFDRG